MNSIIISGYISRDVETRYSQNAKATAVSNFSVAVKRRFHKDDEPDADFFNCVCFGKQAEFAEKYLNKGTKVMVKGSMRQDSYTNKDGQKVYAWKLECDEIDFADGKAQGNTNNGGSKEPKSGKKSNIEPKTDENGFMDIPDEILDDAPFV